MRYIAPPVETQGYHPLWINRHFLDVHAVLNHHANDTDRPSENFGGVLFGRANVDGFV